MRSFHDLKPKSFALNMTPLIDVVFLLIIFFIVSNSMIRQEAAMKLDLPAATTGAGMKKTDTGKIIVNIDGEDRLFLGTRPVTLEQLRFELNRRRLESTTRQEVRIRTDRDVPYARIEPILVICAQCGLGDVSFSVVERKGR